MFSRWRRMYPAPRYFLWIRIPRTTSRCRPAFRTLISGQSKIDENKNLTWNPVWTQTIENTYYIGAVLWRFEVRTFNPILRLPVYMYTLTIWTSESELILSTYIVTPTSTGGPVVNKFNTLPLKERWISSVSKVREQAPTRGILTTAEPRRCALNESFMSIEKSECGKSHRWFHPS